MSRKPRNPDPNHITDSVDLLGAIPQPDQARVTRALMLRWNEISAFSYRSFLENRRGLVLLSFSGKNLECEYLPWKLLKADWDNLMHGSDEIIKTLLRRYVPTYNPELEFVVLLTYNHQNDALVMKVTKAAVSAFYQPANSVIPCLERHEYFLPKQAFQILDSLAPMN